MVRRRCGAGVIALLFAALVLPVGVSDAQDACVGATTVPNDDAARHTATRAVLCLINRVRVANGLRRVRRSPMLGAAARAHSEDMVQRKYFGHAGPRGDTLDDRVRRSGYAAAHPRYAAGEALAWGSFSSPEILVRALLQSPEHRRILLDRRAREVGLGLTLGAPRDGVDGPSSTLVLDFAL
jgi:uncharacterized protein YkwD